MLLLGLSQGVVQLELGSGLGSGLSYGLGLLVGFDFGLGSGFVFHCIRILYWKIVCTIDFLSFDSSTNYFVSYITFVNCKL